MLWVPGLAPALRRPSSAQPQGAAAPVPSLCSGCLPPCPAQEVSLGRTNPFPLPYTPIRGRDGGVAGARVSPRSTGTSVPLRARAVFAQGRLAPPPPPLPHAAFPSRSLPACLLALRRRDVSQAVQRGMLHPKGSHPTLGNPQGFLHEGQEKGVPGAGTWGAQDRVLWALVGFGCQRALGVCSPSCQPAASTGSARGGRSPWGG